MSRSLCLPVVVIIVGLLASCGSSPPRAATEASAPATAPSFKVIELPDSSLPPTRLAFACNPDRVTPLNRYNGLDQTKITNRICQDPFPITKSRPTKTDRDNCFEQALADELGSWGLQVTLAPQPGDPATWQLVYLTKEKQLLKSPPGQGLVIMDYARHPTVPDVPRIAALFDFDGDGRSEVITETRHGSGKESFNIVQVWTAKRDAVTPFGDTASRRLVGIADTNQDRRPDFFMDPYGLPFTGNTAFLAPQDPWSLSVEVTAQGQLVEDGAVAQGHALARCPGASGLRDTLLRTYGACVPQYLHCAKLWELPEQEVEATLDAFCEAERYDAKPYCPSFRATWRQMYGARLPLRLSQPTGGAP